MTEMPTAAAKSYRATVLDLFSRRLPGAATGQHPDAHLARAAITMAVAARGCEHMAVVILHTDRASTHTAEKSTGLCRRLGVRQSMAGSARASTTPRPRRSSRLEGEVLARHDVLTTAQARAVVIDWCYGFDNDQRGHSAGGSQSPINYETAALDR